MSALFFYTLFYFLMSACIVYPPTEFVSAGFTVKDVFAHWLGSENEFFIQYHIRRTICTFLVHSVLPFGYIMGLILFGHIDSAKIMMGHDFTWLILTVGSLLIPLCILYKIRKWYINNYCMHPIARNLAIYCNNNTTWNTVASDINIEFRRVDKIIIVTDSVTRVIATDNWIIKVTPYKVQVAHQSDTALIVNRSDTHIRSPSVRGEVQFINIKVEPTRGGSQSFDIRLNAFDFKDLQDKVSRPITVLHNITFYKTQLDRFIDTFKDQVVRNPVYVTSEELDQCLGCMQAHSNVKLYKSCSSNNESSSEECMTCYCRPTWCIDCMAKWFASRQDEAPPETWLSLKCTCPVCRARFCLLDVCYAESSQ